MLYSQQYGLGSRRSSCVWTEGGDAGVVGGEIDNAADSWPLDHHCYHWSNWSQGLDSWLLPYCCGNLSPLYWAGGKERREQKGREVERGNMRLGERERKKVSVGERQRRREKL